MWFIFDFYANKKIPQHHSLGKLIDKLCGFSIDYGIIVSDINSSKNYHVQIYKNNVLSSILLNDAIAASESFQGIIFNMSDLTELPEAIKFAETFLQAEKGERYFFYFAYSPIYKLKEGDLNLLNQIKENSNRLLTDQNLINNISREIDRSALLSVKNSEFFSNINNMNFPGNIYYHGLIRSFPDPTIYFPFSNLEPNQMVGELLEVCKEYKTLNYCMRPDATGEYLYDFLVRLGEVIEEKLYGINITLEIKQLELIKYLLPILKKAGVKKIELIDSPEDRSVNNFLEYNLRKIQFIKSLHEKNIKVEWNIYINPLIHRNDEIREFVSLMPDLFHLFPPAGVSLNLDSGLKNGINDLLENKEYIFKSIREVYARISSWGKAYHKSEFTYARGPGFIRIFDQKDVRSKWKFFILNGIQAKVFDICRQVVSLDELNERLSGSTKNEIRKTVKLLVENNILFEGSNGNCIVLPVRRRWESRWGSIDLRKGKE